MIVILFFMLYFPGDIVGPFEDENKARNYLKKAGFVQFTSNPNHWVNMQSRFIAYIITVKSPGE